MAGSFFSSQQNLAAAAPNIGGDSIDIALVHKVLLSYDDIQNNIEDIDVLYAEYPEKTDYITKSARHYGAILYRVVGTAVETREELLPIALPYNRNFISVPVVGELVKIYRNLGSTHQYYEKLSPETSPNYSTDITLVLSNSKLTSEHSSRSGGEAADRYNETNNVGITETNRNVGSNETIKNGFAGKYFKRNLKIHQLELNEGDTVLQGRFGNSIRFSGYIHDNKDTGVQFPAILIRNGESANNQNKKVYDVVSEDINNDGTSIQITSGKYKTLYDSTTIKVNKEANDTYPSSDQLVGDQIVVNSGRVILSSKTAETFLFSKKKFSIFTDDIVTIDTEKGYKLISQNGNIEITARGNKNIIMTVNSGSKIFYGKDAADQQAILGNKLVDLLGQLIDAINAMKIATPSGPSAPGPIDKVPFNNIKNQLKDTLSKINYLI
jgi:hypothetical protein